MDINFGWDKMMLIRKRNIIIAVMLTLLVAVCIIVGYRIANTSGEKINILCIGVDKQVGMGERDPQTNSIGQADAIFLVSISPKENEVDIVAIPRDTIVNVEMYNSSMQYLGSTEGQICIQYAYADGMSKSCELTVDRVEELFPGVLIDAYVAININAIMEINDAVGGVEVVVDDAYTAFQMSVWQGTEVNLMGIDAMNYLRVRDCTEEESAYGRMDRIKTYINAFIPKAKEAIKSNPSIIIELYRTLGNNMVTDLTIDSVVSVVSGIMELSFENFNFNTLEGEVFISEDGYEEFYPSDQQIKEFTDILK